MPLRAAGPRNGTLSRTAKAQKQIGGPKGPPISLQLTQTQRYATRRKSTSVRDLFDGVIAAVRTQRFRFLPLQPTPALACHAHRRIRLARLGRNRRRARERKRRLLGVRREALRLRTMVITARIIHHG